MIKIVCNAVSALVMLAVLTGCGPIWPQNPPKYVAEMAEKSATIRQVETTRAAVRALLGEPWLSSRLWQVEVYQVKQMQPVVGLGFIFPLPPVPIVALDPWVGYVLITYDDLDRVRALASTTDGYSLPLLRADDMILAPSRSTYELVLIAGGHRLADYLKLRQQTDACTLIVACEQGVDNCPDGIKIDSSNSLRPRFIHINCSDDVDCPDGVRPQASSNLIEVPVLYPISLAPGEHQVDIRGFKTWGRSGKVETAISCAPGDVRYVFVRSGWVCESFLKKCQFQATLQVTESMPESWSEYSIVIWRGSWQHKFGTHLTLGVESWE